MKWQKKILQRILHSFSCLLDGGITELSMNLNSHGGFLRAELVWAKTSCPMGRIGLAIYVVARKATVQIQFL